MSSNPVIWFEIYVQDIDRAKAFYESVFQVSLEKLNSPETDVEMWSFPMNMSGMGASGSLVKMTGVPSGGSGTLVYFGCDDCAVEEARVKEFGGQIYRAKMSINEYGFISLVLDTEGNMVGLHSMK